LKKFLKVEKLLSKFFKILFPEKFEKNLFSGNLKKIISGKFEIFGSEIL
jgi:hypothetical protein